MASAPFSHSAVTCLVRDLLASEISRSRGQSVALLGAREWHEDTFLVQGGLDLDSLERLNASAALTEFFHLHEFGAEDELLVLPRLGDWCDLVARSLAAGGSRLTFRTSGSTGAPKACTHAIADLLAEVENWTAILGHVRQVVSMIPSHHIYGTLFTAMLPDRLGVEVRTASSGGGLQALCRPGTLVVATPTLWAHVARSCLTVPPGVIGISSTAPMPAELACRLAAQGLDRLIEIYGSSETGGVGFRERPGDPFVLLDRWTRLDDDELEQQGADGPVRHRLMDRAAWLDPRHFRLEGRHDGAVQVGGLNVFPEVVRTALMGHEGVVDAAVRFDAASGRLKAFLVPAPGVRAETLAAAVDRWCGDRLAAVQRPRHFTIGPALPCDAMGKPADW